MYAFVYTVSGYIYIYINIKYFITYYRLNRTTTNLNKLFGVLAFGITTRTDTATLTCSSANKLNDCVPAE